MQSLCQSDICFWIDIWSASSEAELYDGEFDPGSERTLAARFKHASRRVYKSLLL